MNCPKCGNEMSSLEWADDLHGLCAWCSAQADPPANPPPPENPPGPHCWRPGPDTEDGRGTTCMYPDGHKGPHVFVRLDRIVLTFKDEDD
jgi:hypothetical protein